MAMHDKKAVFFTSENIAFRQNTRHISNIYPGFYSELGNDDSLTTCSRTSDKNSVAPWWNIWIPEYAAVRKIEFLTTANITSKFLYYDAISHGL
jgi:hypothetical protein